MCQRDPVTVQRQVGRHIKVSVWSVHGTRWRGVGRADLEELFGLTCLEVTVVRLRWREGRLPTATPSTGRTGVARGGGRSFRKPDRLVLS